MVKAFVNIFDHEDSIVQKTREKFGFRNKNDALNFIIRKFEKSLDEIEQEKAGEIKEDIKDIPDIFKSERPERRGRPSRKNPKKTSKKLQDEKEKQNLDLLKNVLSER